MPRTTNVMARKFVQQKERFDGNNLYAMWRDTHTDYPRYCVFSYGGHWPLFVWENGAWYENIDKYSPTTSKHKTQTHPHEDTMPMSVDSMRVLVDYGVAGLAAGMQPPETYYV